MSLAVQPCTYAGDRVDYPGARDVRDARQAWRARLAEAYAQNSIAQRLELAQRLIALGNEAESHVAMASAWEEAVAVALSAGEVEPAFLAAHRLTSTFNLDATNLQLKVLRMASGADAGRPSKASRIAMCRRLMGLLPTLLERADDDDIRFAATQALKAAEAVDVRKHAQLRQAAQQWCAPALGSLAATASNAAQVERAILADDWPTAVKTLPKLKESARWKQPAEAAALEAGGPHAAERMLRIGNAWAKAAERETGIIRWRMQQRSATWLGRGWSFATPTQRLLIERKLIDAARWKDGMQLNAGVNAELFGDTTLTRRVRQRTYTTIDFDWGESAPDRALPRNDFSMRFNGYLLAPRKQTGRLGVEADRSVRIWLDGEMIINEWQDAGVKRASKEVILSRKPRLLKIEYADLRGRAKLRLLWNGKPVPAEWLWRE